MFDETLSRAQLQARAMQQGWFLKLVELKRDGKHLAGLLFQLEEPQRVVNLVNKWIAAVGGGVNRREAIPNQEPEKKEAARTTEKEKEVAGRCGRQTGQDPKPTRSDYQNLEKRR